MFLKMFTIVDTNCLLHEEHDKQAEGLVKELLKEEHGIEVKREKERSYNFGRVS